jgi:putative exosortase-associated protein (TIGR04073 family)
MRLIMRNVTFLTACVAAVSVLSSGCSGPEQKLGRGVSNMTEILRMGEMRRSVEQTAVWSGPDVGYTTGFVRGMSKTLARTGVGIYEVVTFPIPSYDPLFKHYIIPGTVYPDSYKPNMLGDPLFGPDNNLGFYGGDVMPFVPGSQFRIFDY